MRAGLTRASIRCRCPGTFPVVVLPITWPVPFRDRPLCVGGRIVHASRPSLTRASIRCRCPGTFPVGTGCGFLRPDRRISEDIAATPHRLDVMTATGRLSELLAQLADEHVDDLELGLVHPAIEVVEEHLLSQRRAFAQAEQFEDAVLLTGQVNRIAIDCDNPCVKVYC